MLLPDHQTTPRGHAALFVSYRSGDIAWGLLLDRLLCEQFGQQAVFQASRSIRPGEDFAARILDSIRNCEVLLPIIGHGWQAARRRLKNEHDWVRWEIAEAFAHAKLVIPIVVDDMSPAVIGKLPADIRRLSHCQYLRLHHKNISYDMARIADELTILLPELPGTVGRANAPAR